MPVESTVNRENQRKSPCCSLRSFWYHGSCMYKGRQMKSAHILRNWFQWIAPQKKTSKALSSNRSAEWSSSGIKKHSREIRHLLNQRWMSFSVDCLNYNCMPLPWLVVWSFHGCNWFVGKLIAAENDEFDLRFGEQCFTWSLGKYYDFWAISTITELNLKQQIRKHSVD